MSRRRTRRDRDRGANAVPALALPVGAVLVLSGPARAWLAVWWPLLALGAAVLVVLGVWRLVAVRRGRRAQTRRQALLDRQVASTDGMSGTGFEHLVARLLRRDGWAQVAVSGGAGDLGADVTARHPRDGSLLVVQCKRFTARAVGSPDLQRFLGTVFHHHRADHALFVTTSRYSGPARSLADGSGVHLVDRTGLSEWMAGRPLAVGARPARRLPARR